MGFNPTHARKLASLSALGAGALIVGMGEADATVIYSNFGGTPGKVGFSTGYNVNFQTTNVSPAAGFRFAINSRNYSSTVRRSIFASGINGVNFARTGGNLLKLVVAGGTFGAAPAAGSATAAFRSVKRRYHSGSPGYYSSGLGRYTGTVSPYTTFNSPNHAPDPFSNKFALFKFTTGGQTDFGWIQLALVNNSQATYSGKGPDLKIISWAFDDSGNPLAAGATGVPEPGTFAMTAMGALALGAVGIRRWRAAKA